MTTKKWTSSKNSNSFQLDYLEVCSSSSCCLTIYTDAILLLPGEFWKMNVHFLLSLPFPFTGLTISKHSFTILPWEMLHQNIFFFSTESTVSTLATCLKVYFFSTLKCFMLTSEKQKCSIPVSVSLDLNLRVSLN